MGKNTEPVTAGLALAVIGALAFLGLSFVRIWNDTSSAIFGGNVIDATLSQPIWGTALASHIATFVAALVLIHVALGALAWALAIASRQAWPRTSTSQRQWTVLWLLLLAAWTLAANAAWFPWSSLGQPYARVVTRGVAGIEVFEAATAVLGALLAATLARAIWHRPRSATWPAGIVAVGTVAAAMSSLDVAGTTASTRALPNVIMIGVDSLRPDLLEGAEGAALAPRLTRFLDDATIFTDTLTPLARTFPAWVSIVSGKHPHTTGAFMNLLPRNTIREGDTLPRLLQRIGYRTAYAIDEVRFSNLDESYGFERMIAPPIGSADFLLGFFSDAPLLNLLVNTAVGKRLFPYAHANRAAAVTYDPDTFVDRIAAEVAFDGPTFLAVHLTLVHWPYTWATSPAGLTGKDATARDKYLGAAARVDEQFGDLMDLLERRGALRNAIVVVLSDHGESLGEAASIAADKPSAQQIPGMAGVFGHGTNVFAAEQYRVLLALRTFGDTPIGATALRTVAVPASLEDVAPTLADAFGVEPDEPFDGVSLLPWLAATGAGELDTGRVRFMETEFNPPGFASGTTLRASSIKDAARYYQVDGETDRVLIRPEYLEEILHSRQYAAYRDGHLLATVPADDAGQQRVVYVDPGAAAPLWLDDPLDVDAAPEARALWTALTARFTAVRERPIVAPRRDLP